MVVERTKRDTGSYGKRVESLILRRIDALDGLNAQSFIDPFSISMVYIYMYTHIYICIYVCIYVCVSFLASLLSIVAVSGSSPSFKRPTRNDLSRVTHLCRTRSFYLVTRRLKRNSRWNGKSLVRVIENDSGSIIEIRSKTNVPR